MADINLPVPGSDFNTWGEKLNTAVTVANDQGEPANVRNIVSTDIATVGSDIEGALSAKISQAPASPPLSVFTDWWTTFQTGHGYTSYAGGAIVADTDDYLFGSQSLRTVVTPGTPSKIRNLNYTSPFDWTSKHIVLWIKADNVTNISELSLYIGDSNFGNYYRLIGWGNSAKQTLDNRWTPVVLSLASKASNGGIPAQNNAEDVQISIASVNAPVTVWFGGIGAVPDMKAKFPTGVVTFSFDDGFDSVYTDGRRIMDKYGYPGVLYIIKEWVDGAGKVSMDQLHRLENLHGWEIGGHSYSDAVHTARATGVTPEEFEQDIKLLKAWLRNNGFTSDSYCYPGGEQNQTVIDIVRRYFNTARDTEGNPKLNGLGYLDPLMLCQTGPGSGALNAIANVADYGGWAFLYAHKVGTGGISFTDLEAQVEACKTAGVEVLTPQQVVDRLKG